MSTPSDPQPTPPGAGEPVPPAQPYYGYEFAPPEPPQQQPPMYPAAQTQPYGYLPPPPPGQPPMYPAAPGYPPYQQPRPTNGFAIASMVLGILWIYWIGSILALIFGYIAQKQIRERNESGRGMAIAGIVLGWIGAATLILVIVLVVVGAFANHHYRYR